MSSIIILTSYLVTLCLIVLNVNIVITQDQDGSDSSSSYNQVSCTESKDNLKQNLSKRFNFDPDHNQANDTFLEPSSCRPDIGDQSGQDLSQKSKNPPDTGHHPGHQKPFGQSGSKVKVKVIEEFPETSTFIKDYIQESQPVVIGSGYSAAPALQKWTDAYFMDLAEQMDPENDAFTVETVKKEVRDKTNYGELSFKYFLQNYNKSELYFINHLPDFLAPDCVLPCPLQDCRFKHLLTIVQLWISSGGTSSVAHTDKTDNFLCMVRGTKELYLLPRDFVHKVLKKHIKIDGEFPVDVDSVDLNLYPELMGQTFYHATIEPGNCVFIPEDWLHQVRSYGSNIALNFWFETLRDHPPTRKCRSEPCDPFLPLDQSVYGMRNYKAPFKQKDEL